MLAAAAGLLIFRWWTEKISLPRKTDEEFTRLFPPEKHDKNKQDR
jgi:hypothetical protein